MGLVGTAINPDHSVFEGSNIEIMRLAGSDDLPESGRQHGTAVAALLIGSPASRTRGLVPGGKLIAVNAFYRARHKDDRTDVYGLVRALDLLVERQVDVINLSLAGPENLLLQQAVKKVAERGIIMVAAAGNDGPESDPRAKLGLCWPIMPPPGIDPADIDSRVPPQPSLLAMTPPDRRGFSFGQKA